MLKTINDLVRNVAIIVLIAGFLEMLLPTSEMKRFVKVVMGLFILVSIFNPIISLFNKNISSEVLAWQDPVQTSDFNTILKKGQNLSQEMNEKAEGMYAKSVAKQIETIVKLVKGVSWTEAKVDMGKMGTNNDLGKIQKVVLVIGVGKSSSLRTGGIEPVEVKIGKEEETVVNDSDKEQVKRQVIESLKNFYNLKEEQINVIIANE